jgi:hypothetical protein
MKYGGDEAQDAVAEFSHELHRPALVRWLTKLAHRLFPRFRPSGPRKLSQSSGARPIDKDGSTGSEAGNVLRQSPKQKSR